jgi:two-component system OmpR family response regulator
VCAFNIEQYFDSAKGAAVIRRSMVMATIVIASSDGLDGHDVLEAEPRGCGASASTPVVPGLIVLDVSRENGHAARCVLAWRARFREAALLVIAPRRTEAEAVAAFRAGADHYVYAPAGRLELLARAQALLRRRDNPRVPSNGVAYAGLQIDRSTRIVRHNQRRLALNPIEFRLLDLLTSRRGGAVPRSELLERVWNYPRSSRTRTVDLHVSRLRQKLQEDPNNRAEIVTVWGFGYRMHHRASGQLSHTSAPPSD